jgi:predicted nucleotidyltransferase
MVEVSDPELTLANVRAILRAEAPALEARFGVRLTGVFGSFARGEAQPGSDVDVLAEMGGAPAIHDLLDAQERLEQRVGRPVDLAFRDALAPHWAVLVGQDVVAV